MLVIVRGRRGRKSWQAQEDGFLGEDGYDGIRSTVNAKMLMQGWNRPSGPQRGAGQEQSERASGGEPNTRLSFARALGVSHAAWGEPPVQRPEV